MEILAVDDEPLGLELLVQELKKLPGTMSIQAFASGTDALVYAAVKKVDVAILDIDMPGMDGITLARRIKEVSPTTTVIFSTGHAEYAYDAYQIHASGYLLKPVSAKALQAELEYWKHPELPPAPTCRVRVHTFGNFDVFVDGSLLIFSSALSKELLAYLVDRKGASVTTAEISAVLWEDRAYDRNMKNRVQNVISGMMKTLRESGIANIVVKGWNQLALNVSQVDCDYYRLLHNDLQALNTYTGEYMTNYSWAELTASTLLETVSGK